MPISFRLIATKIFGPNANRLRLLLKPLKLGKAFAHSVHSVSASGEFNHELVGCDL